MSEASAGNGRPAVMAKTPRVPVTVRTGGALGGALGRWHLGVMALDELEAPIVELVRLRAAQHHDCHT